MTDRPRPRKIIGREVVLSTLLGSGSNGDVFLATPMSPSSMTNQYAYPPKFVVKVMKKELYPVSYMEEVMAEVNAIRTLDHPYIVSYVGAWVEAMSGSQLGCFCLAMNYCDGGDLHALICEYSERNEYIPNDLVVMIMVHIFSALNFSHANRVIHRDVKPANIFLTLSSTDHKSVASALLGDYGLARPLERTRDLACTRVGTPCYCSPEIVSGVPYTGKTDIFSAGVTMYELMTGERPFWSKGCTEKQSFYAILHNDPTPYLRSVSLGRYDNSLVRVVSACLGKKERMRPTAYELLTSFCSTLTKFVRVVGIPVCDPTRASPRRAENPSPARRISPVRPAGASPARKAALERKSPIGARQIAKAVTQATEERRKSPTPREDPVKVKHLTPDALLQFMRASSNTKSDDDALLDILGGDTEAYMLLRVLITTRRNSLDALENGVFKVLALLKPQIPIQEITKFLSNLVHQSG